MEITITGRHYQMDGPVKEYLEDKLQKLARLFDRITTVHAVVGQEHGDFRVEVVASVPQGHRFTAHAEGSDLRRTIDQVDHKLEAQLRAHKDRLVDRRH